MSRVDEIVKKLREMANTKMRDSVNQLHFILECEINRQALQYTEDHEGENMLNLDTSVAEFEKKLREEKDKLMTILSASISTIQ